MSVHRDHHIPPAEDHERLVRDYQRPKSTSMDEAIERHRQHKNVVARRYGGPTVPKEQSER